MLPVNNAYKLPESNPDVMIWLSQNAVVHAPQLLSRACRHLAVGPHTASLNSNIEIPTPPYTAEHLLMSLSQTNQVIWMIGPKQNKSPLDEHIKYIPVYKYEMNKSLPPQKALTDVIVGSKKQLTTLLKVQPNYFDTQPHLRIWAHTKDIQKMLPHHPSYLTHAHDIDHTLQQIQKHLYNA